MKKVLFLSVLVALLLTAAAPAFAGLTWCMVDPHIKLPDGGVFHLMVAVPDENRDSGLVLDIVAPAGSEIVGRSQKVAMTVTLLEGPADQITATVNAGFAVRLAGRLRNVEFAPVEFASGGAVTWNW
jgi:hypothetical protein